MNAPKVSLLLKFSKNVLINALITPMPIMIPILVFIGVPMENMLIRIQKFVWMFVISMRAYTKIIQQTLVSKNVLITPSYSHKILLCNVCFHANLGLLPTLKIELVWLTVQIPISRMKQQLAVYNNVQFMKKISEIHN